MRIPIICFLVLLTGNVFADIGDSPEAAEKKYGKGTETTHVKDEKTDLLTVNYKTNKYLIKQFYMNSKCYRMNSEILSHEKPSEATLLQTLKTNFPGVDFPKDASGFEKKKDAFVDLYLLSYKDCQASYAQLADDETRYDITVKDIKNDKIAFSELLRISKANKKK